MTAQELYIAATGDEAPSNQIFYHEWYQRYVSWMETRIADQVINVPTTTSTPKPKGVKVYYHTEFGVQKAIMKIEKLAEFSKKFKLSNVEFYNE